MKRAKRTISNIRIVQGPPGVGKTSLLNHIAAQYTHDAVIPIHLSGGDLMRAPAVASGFMRSCGFDPNLLRKAESPEIEGLFGLRWAGLRVGRNTAMHAPEERLKTGTPLWDVLSDCLDVSPETVFLVLVDEAQRIQRDKDSEINAIATQLHDGESGGLMTTAVFAGLSDTTSRLMGTGISRPPNNALHHLSTLSHSETEEAIRKFLEHEPFGLSAIAEGDKKIITHTLAQVSEGYPRHLHSYFTGLAKECATKSRVDFEAALGSGHQTRIDYYELRLRSARLGKYNQALFSLSRSHSQRTMLSQDIIDSAKEAGLSEDQALALHAQAIHCGVLDYDPDAALEDDRVRFPIPSFHAYMKTGGNREKALDLMIAHHKACLRALAGPVDKAPLGR